MSESFFFGTETLLKTDRVFSCEIRDIFKKTFFYRAPLVAASDGFRFPACNFIKKETPARMLFCEF